MPISDPQFEAALALIEARSNYARGFISNPASQTGGLARGLTRTRALLDLLGAPDRAYPIVHIAGSKGKGSTAAYVAAIGQAAGYRTGLSTSPHLHSFRERIVIDGSPISRSDFGRIGGQVAQAVAELEQNRPDLGEVTAFELLTVMALLSFRDAGCELAVVEVGLGGTWDATNVVSPAVSIITRLDLEHTQLLGDTLAEIAANKAGIIEHGVPVVTTRQEPDALAVIAATAGAHAAPLLRAGRDFHWSGHWPAFQWEAGERSIAGLRVGMPGDHQMENAALAIATWQVLETRGMRADTAAVQQGVAAASLPGRFERIEHDGRIWILDGAHTPVAAAALADAIAMEFGEPIGAICGLLRDKHADPFFHALAPAVAALIVTEPRNPRAIPVDELLPIGRSVDSQTIARNNLETSLATARTWFPAELPVVITGSFTLVAEARERFGLALDDR